MKNLPQENTINSIAATLTSIVDAYMQELMAQSIFFTRLRQGHVTPEVMAYVLETIAYALRYTPVHLQRAEAMARQRGNLKLAQFFKNKFAEEFRHDEWAVADLKSLPCPPEAKEKAQPVSGVVGLMDYMGEVIKTNPLNYLAYIFMNEHIAANVFPEIIEKLDSLCHIDRAHVTVLSKHAELDQLHSADDEMILNDLYGESISTPPQRQKKAEFLATLYQSLAYYEQMFLDFSALTQKSA